MFFDNWSGLGRVLIVACLAYGALVALLRISGARTLSKMNTFDLVVTVALGSTLASIIVTEQVALAEGALAFGALIGLQFAVTWSLSRSPRLSRIVKTEPALLFFDGRFLRGRMRTARVVEEEVRSAVRGQGIASLDDVLAVVLETDGSFSVVRRSEAGSDRSALRDVEFRAI
jgi:uncharacterized membrane protein YcaP (DUF421 family)